MDPTSIEQHLAMLNKRLLRLQRIYAYKQDGHGNDLSDQALVMVCLCVAATMREWNDAIEVGA